PFGRHLLPLFEDPTRGFVGAVPFGLCGLQVGVQHADVAEVPGGHLPGGVGVPLLGVDVLPEEGGFVGAEDDAAGGAVEDDAEALAAGGALRVLVGGRGLAAGGA